jgi:hypothetical protein
MLFLSAVDFYLSIKSQGLTSTIVVDFITTLVSVFLYLQTQSKKRINYGKRTRKKH